MALTESYAVGPADPPVRDITLGRLLAEGAEAVPDRIALITGIPDPDERRQWTYAELYADAERAAHALRTRFEPGERVAVWAPNIPEWVMLEFGCAMAGIVLVTVNPAFRSHELEYVLNQSRSAGLFVVPEFRGNPMMATAEEVHPNCPDLREIITFDRWDEFIADADEFDGELVEPEPSDAVMIQYTSGTTGFPKGALLHHRGLVNNGAHTAERMGVSEGCVWVTTMPLFHTGGCVCCVIGADVKSADGEHVGKIERIYTNAELNRATHLLITEGWLFKEKRLIPVEWISTVDEDEIRLGINAHNLAQVPEYQGETV
jgi:fatty-acyl-CoA synthase